MSKMAGKRVRGRGNKKARKTVGGCRVARIKVRGVCGKGKMEEGGLVSCLIVSGKAGGAN